jgi:hypothetical protein
MRRAAVALLAGLIVFALLFFWGGGIDTDPPICFGMFGWYTVPCEGWVAPAAGLVTAGLVWLGLGVLDRGGRRSTRAVLAVAGLVAAIVVIGIPFLVRASIPPDEPAPSWAADFVEAGRGSLLDNDELLPFPHYRFIGTMCGGDGVALLYERRSYPYLSHVGAYVVTSPWPPSDPGSFGGAMSVTDFEQSLENDWLPRVAWGECDR